MKIWLKLPFIIITLVFVLFPLFFTLPNPEFNLAYLLFSAVALLLFYYLVNLGQQKKIIINTSPFTQGVILLLLSFLVSTFLAANKTAGLLPPLGFGILIVLSIWYVLLSNTLSIKKFSILLKISLVTGVIFSIFIIFANLSVFKLLSNFKNFSFASQNLLLANNFINFTNFNTDPYVSLSFILPILIISAYYLYGLFKNNNYIPCHSRVNGNLYNNYNMDPPVKLEDDRMGKSREILLVVAFFLLLTASLLTLPFPSSSPPSPSSSFSTFSTSATSAFSLPYQSGWSIAMDTLKNLKTALVGYGVNNFSVAFNLNRPAGLNSAFSRSSNFIFHFMTENGLLGILAFLYLLFLVFKETRLFLSSRIPFLSSRATERSEGVEGSSAERVSLDSSTRPAERDFGRNDNINELIFLGFWSTVLLMFLLSPNLILLFYFFTFLGLMNLTSPPKTLDLANLENTIWIVCGTLITLIFLIVYLAGRAYLAEFNYQKALFAISKNAKVGPVYSLLKSSVDLNPYLPKYRETLSQTLLFWGTSLTKKDNITQKDRQDGTTLIQQAISQAQQAISLNPQDGNAWQNLGEIYRNLVLAVNTADLWAQTSLTQAVALDPNNPQVRFSLAGLYLQLSQWENAKRQLEIAVSLDPLFANGFYNLYYVQKQQGLYSDALNSLNSAIGLTTGNASQSAQLQLEKTALEKLVKPASPEPSPKLQLPQSSSPPAHFKP